MWRVIYKWNGKNFSEYVEGKDADVARFNFHAIMFIAGISEYEVVSVTAVGRG